MKHYFTTIGVAVTGLIIVVNVFRYLLPDYQYLINDSSFFFGWLLCFGTYMVRFYFLEKEADKKTAECSAANNSVKQLKAEVEKFKYGDDLMEIIEKSQSDCSRFYSNRIVEEFNKLTTLQMNKVQAALEELKNAPPAESVQKTLDQQRNALIAARQERGLIKEIASKIFFQNNQSVWEYIAKELHAAKSRQPLPEKTFTPSAPTKGPRSNKYKQYW